MSALARLAERLAGSAGLRRAANNLAWLTLEKGLRLCAGLVVGTWVARHLGPADFGLLNYALALAGLLLFVPALGLDDIVRSEILRAPDDDTALRALGTAWRLRLAAGAASVALFILAALGRAEGDERLLLLIVAPTLLQPALLLPEVYFQARDKSRRGAKVQLVALALGTGARAALAAGGAGPACFAAVGVGELLLAGGLGWRLMRAEGRPDWWRRWDGGLAARLLRAGWPLLLASAAVSVYMKIDQVMLREMSGEAATGIYAAAVRLSEAIYFLPVAMVMALLPAWSRARERGGESADFATQGMYDLLTAVGLAFALPVSLLSEWLVVWLFGAKFAPAAPVLAIHAWAAVFVCQGVVRSQEWIQADLNRWTFATTFAGAAANVALNLAWIPRYGAEGAAAATLVSYGFAVWLLPLCFRPTRPSALRQTKALLLPLTGWRYLRHGRESR